MKNKIVKVTLTIFLLYVIYTNSNKVYGISDDFLFVISTIGVPRYNVYGNEINEEIYKAYNVFSYGWPEHLDSNSGQRWKNSKYGLWAKGLGKYNGTGVRGEYNLLGRDYSGNIINNYYFPVDVLPTDTPEYWQYYTNPGAAQSWNDKNKYKYVEQLEYMKNTKLLFNDISSRDNADNPGKIKEYNITALNIGLDKARLDVSSTWKTNGIIHTRRKVGNNIRYAVFLTNPMAADANVQANIGSLLMGFSMKSKEDKINIPITYGASIINMKGYAKEEHVKEITSKLYVNGKLVDKISGSKTDTVGKKYSLTLTRDELIENEYNNIQIVNQSYAHTEFAVDGLMQDRKVRNIRVFVNKKEIVPLKINSVKVLEKESNNLVVRPLAQFKESHESQGVTEAGKYLAIKTDINEKIKYENLSDIKLYFDDMEISDIEVQKSELNNKVCIIFKIPNYIESSIFGWKSLRQLYGNYFDINENDIGKRINEPHEINIKTKYEDKDHEITIKVDTIDDYITNINYRYTNSINQDKGVIELRRWLEET